MISKETAMSLPIGKELYHVTIKNADGTPERWRVNGKCKTWKSSPKDFSLPIKHGMYSYAHLTPDNCNKLNEDFLCYCGNCGNELLFSCSRNPNKRTVIFCIPCRKEMKNDSSK